MPTAELGSGAQVLKSRDDTSPHVILVSREPEDAEQPFHLEGSKASWAGGDLFGRDRLRQRIEPWLTSLFQSDHLSLLVGSGLTHAVHSLATTKPLPGMAPMALSGFQTAIEEEVARIAKATQRGGGNFEDQIRVVRELLRGLTILAPGDAELSKKAAVLQADLEKGLAGFAASILTAERGVVEATEVPRENAFNYLVSFLMSFASRTGTRDRLQIFTTNYDRFIEAGAELAGLHLLDRFVGSLSPILRSSRLDVDVHYNPPGIRGEPRYLEGVARFTKLHGSVDWVHHSGQIRRIGLPLGATNLQSYLESPGLRGSDALQLMIYPNAAKDRETSAYPYVELFRDLAAAICRPNSTLVTYGYSFGDEHINRVIEDMLTIPSTHLVIIAYDDPLGRIRDTYDRIGRHAQITMLLGDHLGDLSTLVDNYLPKPAIDRTTFKMADLLKARWSTKSETREHDAPGEPEAGIVA